MSKKKLPVVEVDNDTGHYRVELAPQCYIEWWLERRDGFDHHLINVITPMDVPVCEVPRGYSVTRPTRN
jgi:hypothetical protein